MRTSWPACRCAVAAAVSGLVLLPVGCGTAGSTTGTSASAASSANPLAGLTASQILRKAVANLNAASSVHISGSLMDSGQSVVLDMTVGAKGCRATLAEHGRGSLWMLKIGKTVWVKPDRQFYQSLGVSAADLDLMAGKYLQVSAKSGLGSLTENCSLPKSGGPVTGPGDHVGKGVTTTILGQPALQVKDTTQPGIAYVTISASPELLRVGDNSGYLDFTDYNAPVTFAPPPASETIDGAKFGF